MSYTPIHHTRSLFLLFIYPSLPSFSLVSFLKNENKPHDGILCIMSYVRI